MSLIVSKIINNRIYIESDSRISDIGININKIEKKSIYGKLKTIILNPQVAISFSGVVEDAEKAILEIYELKKGSFNNLLELLFKHNYKTNSVHFIICSLINNKPLIYKIADRKIESNLTTAWIGDHSGFNDFQKHYHKLKNDNKTNEEQFLTGAFSQVIDNPNITTVGDFHVSTITEVGPFGDSFFRYFEKFKFTLGNTDQNSSKAIRKEGDKTTTTLTLHWGKAEDGSFAICYYVSVSGFNNAVAYYFIHGNFGVLFYPRKSFDGIIIKNKTALEFLQFVDTEYKIKLRGFQMCNNNTGVQIIDMRKPI